MEKNIETTIVYWGYNVGVYRDNGKEHRKHYSILGFTAQGLKLNEDLGYRVQ